MLASVCRRRCPTPVALPFLFPCSTQAQARRYAQQKTARTPRSTTQQTTTNPSPTAQVKNRNLPGSTTPSSKVQPRAASPPAVDEIAFTKARQADVMREMEETGSQLEMMRMSYAAGMDPWANKMILLDLRIPSKLNSFRALKDNFFNGLQNVLSMYRLASDFAFPGIVTRWKMHPQIFRATSTSEKAWVAPFRQEFLEIYTRINQAIAKREKKALTNLTAYDYQTHAYDLLQRNLTRKRQTGITSTWSLHSLLSPVQIISLRVVPLYTAPEEPRYGNRNVAQALVRFETMQTLTSRNANGRILRPDGSVVDKNEEATYKPEPRRVLEYLVYENKMFYKDGWYVRDQMFEGLKPKFKDAVR